DALLHADIGGQERADSGYAREHECRARPRNLDDLLVATRATADAAHPTDPATAMLSADSGEAISGWHSRRTSAWVRAVGDRAVTDRRDADCLVVVGELIDDAVGAYPQGAQAVQPAT